MQSWLGWFNSTSKESAAHTRSITLRKIVLRNPSLPIHDQVNQSHTRSIMLHNTQCCATWLIVYGPLYCLSEFRNPLQYRTRRSGAKGKDVKKIASEFITRGSLTERGGLKWEMQIHLYKLYHHQWVKCLKYTEMLLRCFSKLKRKSTVPSHEPMNYIPGTSVYTNHHIYIYIYIYIYISIHYSTHFTWPITTKLKFYRMFHHAFSPYKER
jgi:hypothetical protein